MGRKVSTNANDESANEVEHLREDLASQTTTVCPKLLKSDQLKLQDADEDETREQAMEEQELATRREATNMPARLARSGTGDPTRNPRSQTEGAEEFFQEFGVIEQVITSIQNQIF